MIQRKNYFTRIFIILPYGIKKQDDIIQFDGATKPVVVIDSTINFGKHFSILNISILNIFS